MFKESSLQDLYQSSVDAFPKTTLRQYATHPIIVKEIRWVPFVGMKTLFVKGYSENTHHNTAYEPMILFKKVDYTLKEVSLVASDQKKYHFGKLSLENTDVALRCSCKDFQYRFNYYNSLVKSLYGRKRSPYQSKGIGPPANPLKMEGICKHLMNLSKVLKESGIFVEM